MKINYFKKLRIFSILRIVSALLLSFYAISLKPERGIFSSIVTLFLCFLIFYNSIREYMKNKKPVSMEFHIPYNLKEVLKKIHIGSILIRIIFYVFLIYAVFSNEKIIVCLLGFGTIVFYILSDMLNLYLEKVRECIVEFYEDELRKNNIKL